MGNWLAVSPACHARVAHCCLPVGVIGASAFELMLRVDVYSLLRCHCWRIRIVLGDPADRERDLEAGRQGVGVLVDDVDGHTAPTNCEG